MYAIFQSGGHQYRVSEGDIMAVERLPQPAVGDSVTFDEVLMIGGESVRVGTPLVDGVRVRATVLGEAKAKKLTVFKYKNKNRYRVKSGHRQNYTRLHIDAIEG